MVKGGSPVYKWNMLRSHLASLLVVEYLYSAVPLLAGFLLRLYGIGFGRALGVLFGDELVVAREASELVANLQPFAVHPNGWLFYLICAPFHYILSLGENRTLNPRFVYDVPFFERILVGRALNVVFGVAGVLIAFLIAQRLWGKRAAFWSALGIALSPSMVVEAHFNATSTSLTFWFLLTLLFLIRIHQDNPRFGYLALAAAVLAFLTKPNGVVALLLVMLFSLWQFIGKWRRSDKVPLPVILSILAVTLLGGVIITIRWRWLWRVISTFLWTYEKGTRPVYAWAWLWKHEGALLALGLVGALYNHLDDRVRWPVIITTSLYGIGSLFFRVFFVRWLLPLVSVATLLTGGLAESLLSTGSRKTKHLVTAGLLGIFLLMGRDAYSLVHNLANDIREGSWVWIQESIPPGSRIAVQGDWLSEGVPAQMYRIETLKELASEPDFYIQRGFNYLVVWRGGLDYYNWRPAPSWVGPRERYRALYETFELIHKGSGTILHIPVRVGIDILRVTDNPVYPEAQLVLGGGWHAIEVDESSGAEFRWMTERGQVFYNWSGTGAATRMLSFDSYVFPGRDEISVYVNGERVEALVLGLPDTLHHIELPITLSPGLNEIQLVSERGCGRPVVFDLNSRDTRCLSIKVANLTLGPVQ
ncbi:MAG TPA: hypothetical protein ENI39_04490 [Anaerolineae bacterium]|nr:hypothetical protein [Anaerolineae bacterium]